MSNDTFIREVDEELRGERLRGLWKRFGPYIIGAAVAVVLIVAVNEGWSWWQRSTAADASDRYYAALELAEQGDAVAAQAALEDIADDGGSGYATLARFREAALHARRGERAEAIAAYDALANSASNPRLRELALVLAAYLLIDDGDPAAVRQRVGGLAVEGGPMRNAAREAIGLALFGAGENAAALESFEQIVNDPLSERFIRERVQIYIAQLTAMGAAADEAVAARAAAAAAAAEAAANAAATEAPEATPDTSTAMEPSVGEGTVIDVPAETTPAIEAAEEPVADAAPAPLEEPVPEVPQPAAEEAGADASEQAAPANN